jgi:hypothetical protein
VSLPVSAILVFNGSTAGQTGDETIDRRCALLLALRSSLASPACPPRVALLPGLPLIASCPCLSLTTLSPGLSLLARLPGLALRSSWCGYIATTNKQQEHDCH